MIKHCYYCGILLVKRKSIKNQERPRDTQTRDHKIPRIRGGNMLDRSNLVYACSGCNEEKGQLIAEEYKIVLRYRQIKYWYHSFNLKMVLDIAVVSMRLW